MFASAARGESAAVGMTTDTTGQMNRTVPFPPSSFKNPEEQQRTIAAFPKLSEENEMC